MNPMWNKSEQISGFKLTRMTCRLVLLFSLMEFSSGYTLSAVPLVCPGKKCPKGYFSFCPRNETFRCIPCREGTFSSDPSRRRTCRPCSRCRDSEYELWPCTSTSNVVCKGCSQCPSGFEVVQSCDRTRDTVCRNKCHSPVPFEAELGIECIKTGEQFKGERLKKKKAEKGKTKDSMTIIEVENPLWTNGTRKPGKQMKPSSGFSRVQPTPQSPHSNSPYSTAAIATVPTHSVDTLTHSFVVPRTSTLGSGKSIGQSHTTKDSAKFPHGSVPTAKRKESLPSDVLQGDQPRRPSRRHSEENRTREIPSFPPKPEPSDGSMPNIDQTNLIERNVRGKPKEITTVPFLYTRVREGYEMPSPGNESYVAQSHGSFSSTAETVGVVAAGVTVVTVAVVLFVLLVFRVVKRSKPLQGSRAGCVCSRRSGFRPSRRPRCPGSSDCCEGNSVSSVAVACSTDQNDRNPTYTTYTVENEDLPNSCQTTQITEITADVHRSTVFDLFPAIRGTDQGVCAYRQFITHAEKTFDSSGGQLSHPDSNVVINIESGTISEGNSQRIFFRVVNNDTWLLRDIPETCQRSLISPVIQCGPEDINPLKPVEIVLPHCLYVDEVKKTSISVFRCGEFSDRGPVNWEKVPLASEKNGHSKAWFTVKSDSIVIKTKTFSFWSVFTCGGPKRKRATAFASKPNPNSDLISIRFFIYSDNEDSKRRVERIETERFTDSKPVAMERPFKMFNDSKDITVWLDTEALAKSGWELDHTPATQTYIYEMAYKNGYRSYEACCFSVKPIPSRQASVDGFSCNLYFQQEDHPQHFLYVNPGITPLAHQGRFSVLNNSNGVNGVTRTQTPSELDLEAPASTAPPQEEQEPVTQTHCLCICNHVGADWKCVLRFLEMDETAINNLDEDNKNAKVSEKCYQGFLEWINSVGPREATIGRLRHALRRTGCTRALEKLSSRDDGQRLAPIPESTTSEGTSTCV